MARKSSQSFVAPHGEDGKFLPRSEWPKKVQKEFDRLRKQGAFKGIKKNPIVKSSSGRRRGKDVWIPPHDRSGRFLPMLQWSAADKKAYRKALKDGLVPGSLVPRSSAGKFAIEGGARSKRSRGGRAQRQDDEWFGSDDVYDIKRGIRRLEHRLEDLTDDLERATGRRHVSSGRVCADGSCGVGQTRVTQINEPREYDDYDDPPVDVDFEECQPGTCEAEILGKQKETLDRLAQLSEVCQGSLDQFERHGGLSRNRGRALARNSSERLMMYNRPRTLGQRFDTVLGYARHHPVIAIVGVGALTLLGIAIYKMIRTVMSNMVAGAAIRQGVMSFPGSDPYMITQEDSLWLVRAIWGEVNRSNDGWERSDIQRGSAAVLWALANNYMTVGQKRRLYPTFGNFIQAYCQPINPIWSSAGASGCQRNPGACTADRLAFRQALRSKPWAQFPPGAQALVTAFVAGSLQNPIGRRTDWAAASEGRRTADAVNIADNIFITDPTARSRTVA